MRRAGHATDRLLAYREDGGWHEVHAHEINERFKELAGEEFTAKDLRTWNATVLAAVAFADTEPPASRRGRKRAVAAVMREVAEGLGNTPAVSRRSYVDPQVVRAFNRDLTTLRRARTIDDDHESRALIDRAVVLLLGNRGLCD
jgi:DNA topoisomerase-1